ncbi:transcription factor TFIIIB component B'' homolog [Pelobates fuscus]|uniref:transcription factor TFIIIB component B'' homolog n=1 Tax=Pelobates fuscus TaxID=191477 RepID=UPI002FE46428
MIRRPRINFKPIVRPGGRSVGGGVAQVAPRSDPTDPSQENAAGTPPREGNSLPAADHKEPQAPEDKQGSQNEKELVNGSESQPIKVTPVPFQRRKRISTLPNLAKPRASNSSSAITPSQKPSPVEIPLVQPNNNAPVKNEVSSPEKPKLPSSPKSPTSHGPILGQPHPLPEKRTPVPHVPQFSPNKKPALKLLDSSPGKSVQPLTKEELCPLKERPSQESSVNEASLSRTKPTPIKKVVVDVEKERLRRAQKLRDLLRDELRKERKAWKEKHPIIDTSIEPERSKMTMRDFVHFIPVNNPMKSSFEERKNSEKSQSTETPITTTDVKNTPLEEDGDLDEDENDSQFVVPRVKVAEDGSIILDEESLTVEVTRAKAAIVEENDPIFERGSTTTYSSFRKNTHSKPWSNQETEMFFLAISMVGTDFSMIGQLFPHRERIEIKNKFKREERANGWRIDKAFSEKQAFDFDFFAKLLERALAEKTKKPRSPRVKKPQEKKSPKTRKKPKDKQAAETKSKDCDENEANLSEGEMADLRTAEKENEETLGLNDSQTSLDLAPVKKKRQRKNKEADSVGSVEENSLEKGKKSRKKNKQETEPKSKDCDENEANLSEGELADSRTSEKENEETLGLNDSQTSLDLVPVKKKRQRKKKEAGSVGSVEENGLQKGKKSRNKNKQETEPKSKDCDENEANLSEGEMADSRTSEKENCETLGLNDSQTSLDLVPVKKKRQRKHKEADSVDSVEENGLQKGKKKSRKKNKSTSGEEGHESGKEKTGNDDSLTTEENPVPDTIKEKKRRARKKNNDPKGPEKEPLLEDGSAVSPLTKKTKSRRKGKTVTFEDTDPVENVKEDVVKTLESLCVESEESVHNESITLFSEDSDWPEGDLLSSTQLMDVHDCEVPPVSDLSTADEHMVSVCEDPMPGSPQKSTGEASDFKRNTCKESSVRDSVPKEVDSHVKDNSAEISQPGIEYITRPEPNCTPPEAAVERLAKDTITVSESVNASSNEDLTTKPEAEMEPVTSPPKPAPVARGRFQKPKPNLAKSHTQKETVAVAEDAPNIQELALEGSSKISLCHKEDLTVLEKHEDNKMEVSTVDGMLSLDGTVPVTLPIQSPKDSPSKHSESAHPLSGAPEFAPPETGQDRTTTEASCNEKPPGQTVRGRLIRPKPNLARAPGKVRQLDQCQTKEQTDKLGQTSDKPSITNLPLETPKLDKGTENKSEDHSVPKDDCRPSSIKPTPLVRSRFQKPKPNLVRTPTRIAKPEENHSKTAGASSVAPTHHKEEMCPVKKVGEQRLEIPMEEEGSTQDSASVPIACTTQSDSSSASSHSETMDMDSIPEHLGQDATSELFTADEPLRSPNKCVKSPAKFSPLACDGSNEPNLVRISPRTERSNVEEDHSRKITEQVTEEPTSISQSPREGLSALGKPGEPEREISLSDENIAQQTSASFPYTSNSETSETVLSQNKQLDSLPGHMGSEEILKDSSSTEEAMKPEPVKTPIPVRGRLQRPKPNIQRAAAKNIPASNGATKDEISMNVESLLPSTIKTNNTVSPGGSISVLNASYREKASPSRLQPVNEGRPADVLKPAVLSRSRFQRPKPNLARAAVKKDLSASDEESKATGQSIQPTVFIPKTSICEDVSKRSGDLGHPQSAALLSEGPQSSDPPPETQQNPPKENTTVAGVTDVHDSFEDGVAISEEAAAYEPSTHPTLRTAGAQSPNLWCTVKRKRTSGQEDQAGSVDVRDYSKADTANNSLEQSGETEFGHTVRRETSLHTNDSQIVHCDGNEQRLPSNQAPEPLKTLEDHKPIIALPGLRIHPKPNLTRAVGRKEASQTLDAEDKIKADEKFQTPETSCLNSRKVVESSCPAEGAQRVNTAACETTRLKEEDATSLNIKPAQLRRGRLVRPKPNLARACNRKESTETNQALSAEIEPTTTETHNADPSVSSPVTKRKAAEYGKTVSPKKRCPSASEAEFERYLDHKVFVSGEQQNTLSPGKPQHSAKANLQENSPSIEVNSASSGAEPDCHVYQRSRFGRQLKRPVLPTPPAPSHSEPEDSTEKDKNLRSTKSSIGKSRYSNSVSKKCKGKTTLIKLRASQEEEEEDDDDAQLDFEEENYNLAPDMVNQAPVFVPFSLRSPRPVPSEIEETVEELEIPVEILEVPSITDGTHTHSHLLPDAQSEHESPDNSDHVDGSTEAAMTLISMGNPVFQSRVSEPDTGLTPKETEPETPLMGTGSINQKHEFENCEDLAFKDRTEEARSDETHCDLLSNEHGAPGELGDQDGLVLMECLPSQSSDSRLANLCTDPDDGNSGVPFEQINFHGLPGDSQPCCVVPHNQEISDNLSETGCPDEETTFILTLVEIPLNSDYQYSCDTFIPEEPLPAPVMVSAGSAHAVSTSECQSTETVASSVPASCDPCIPPDIENAESAVSPISRKRRASNSEAVEAEPFQKKPLLQDSVQIEEQHVAEKIVEKNLELTNVEEESTSVTSIPGPCQEDQIPTSDIKSKPETPSSSTQDTSELAVLSTENNSINSTGHLPAACSALPSKTTLKRPGKKPLGILGLVCKEKAKRGKEDLKSKTKTLPRPLSKKPSLSSRKSQDKVSTRNNASATSIQVPSQTCSLPAVSVVPSVKEEINDSGKPQDLDNQINKPQELPSSTEDVSEEEVSTVSEYFFDDIFMPVDDD